MGNNIGCVTSIGHGENLTEYIERLLCTRMCEIIESDAACVNRIKLSRATVTTHARWNVSQSMGFISHVDQQNKRGKGRPLQENTLKVTGHTCVPYTASKQVSQLPEDPVGNSVSYWCEGRL